MDSGLPRSAKSSVNNSANLITGKDSNNSNANARGTKRGRDSLLADEDEFKTKPEIKIVIPDLLKVKLVDDWEAITKNAQVCLIYI